MMLIMLFTLILLLELLTISNGSLKPPEQESSVLGKLKQMEGETEYDGSLIKDSEDDESFQTGFAEDSGDISAEQDHEASNSVTRCIDEECDSTTVEQHQEYVDYDESQRSNGIVSVNENCIVSTSYITMFCIYNVLFYSLYCQ